MHKEEGGLTHLITYTKTPFCMYLIIFSYARHFYYILLSLVSTFISVLQNISDEYFPVSQIFYCLFVYRIIDWIFKSTPARNVCLCVCGGEGVRWEGVRTQ